MLSKIPSKFHVLQPKIPALQKSGSISWVDSSTAIEDREVSAVAAGAASCANAMSRRSPRHSLLGYGVLHGAAVLYSSLAARDTYD